MSRQSEVNDLSFFLILQLRISCLFHIYYPHTKRSLRAIVATEVIFFRQHVYIVFWFKCLCNYLIHVTKDCFFL